MDFKDRLKNLRHTYRDKKINQLTIAEAIGVDRSTYTKYETGDSEPDFKTLVKLADFFNVSVDYLLGRDNPYNISHNQTQFIPQKEEPSEYKITPDDIKHNLVAEIVSKIKDMSPEQLSMLIKIIEAIKK